MMFDRRKLSALLRDEGLVRQAGFKRQPYYVVVYKPDPSVREKALKESREFMDLVYRDTSKDLQELWNKGGTVLLTSGKEATTLARVLSRSREKAVDRARDYFTGTRAEFMDYARAFPLSEEPHDATPALKTEIAKLRAGSLPTDDFGTIKPKGPKRAPISDSLTDAQKNALNNLKGELVSAGLPGKMSFATKPDPKTGAIGVSFNLGNWTDQFNPDWSTTVNYEFKKDGPAGKAKGRLRVLPEGEFEIAAKIDKIHRFYKRKPVVERDARRAVRRTLAMLEDLLTS
jgi:hypothetical protein